MSRPVDVLAVVGLAAERAVLLPELAEDLKQARAAVATLIEAARAGSPDSFGQILFDERAAERLLAAIARVKGGAL